MQINRQEESMCKRSFNRPTRNKEMKKVSVRTLVLLMELFVAVLGHQYIAWTPPAQAEVLWLAGEPNETSDSPSEIAPNSQATADQATAAY